MLVGSSILFCAVKSFTLYCLRNFKVSKPKRKLMEDEELKFNSQTLIGKGRFKPLAQPLDLG